ncbi:hydrolase or acyltransferase of alpha/beta hydrolase superfamily [Candidatus Kinetoplastibacterium blastocrithidii TCC012E]|uniref:Hydrolase or acyltransferase of alpha/beta hydrolase superfamily n=1 Tax=Candidatus Kinetoplastidibacterium blastocrithidiae TCC012E TaxID=1208922 RepID=M1M153_9PROT|nr:alpha/beta hydrolase [Candidatus Kinetoplastibacterium blastocrithidii]AFZ83198.1 hydrolase [Candidatus Kinetoplastibacterium blastocrithidii (ex Strigomonas culicis)]AGF50011.1 hydrolase or acyltransferase of alpha/beta hydrolase superfamily [Candidatus Kinetoplastibacterium blastocrithidii TCC012E]
MKTIKLNQYNFHYVNKGTGMPLLLIHGSLCDSRYWKKQTDRLCINHEIFALNLRHYWPNKFDLANSEFSLDQHSYDIIKFIQEVVKKPVNILGHSRGATLSLNIAAKKPELINKLILAEPGGLIIPGMHDQKNDFKIHVSDLIEQNKIDDALELFIDKVSGSGTWKKMVQWFKEMARDNAHTLIGQSLEKMLFLSSNEIRNISIPTLLIGGEISPEPYPRIIKILHDLIPQNYRVVVNGSSHGMNLGNPAFFNKTVLDFICT